MAVPLVVPRSQHPVSRRLIDPDALKVLYRLHRHGYIAYLVGGSVRDLLLGRRPKDFDVGTSAHPYEVKRLFRNCWIIGRRFRLAHVRFGSKIIEVATFRRGVPPGSETDPPMGHENTFGTPEEDAFRRDFTINALFYDIASRALIDYVGGLADLDARLVRSIGDPRVRFVEDPVRMLRAVALAARLDFRIDPPILEAIADHKAAIARASPARMLEELFKILRSGAAERTFRHLAEVDLLRFIAPELAEGASPRLWQWLARLDAYRARFETVPASLTPAILLGSLLVPLNLMGGEPPTGDATAPDGRSARGRVRLGALPLPRRELEHLRQILSLQRRLEAVDLPARARRRLLARPLLPEALTWLELHGEAPTLADAWRQALGEQTRGEARPLRRGRRRRRRRHRPTAPLAADPGAGTAGDAAAFRHDDAKMRPVPR